MSSPEHNGIASLSAKARHDIRSRFAALIGLLDIIADEPGYGTVRKTVLQEKARVELVLEDLLTFIGTIEATTPDSFHKQLSCELTMTAVPALNTLSIRMSQTLTSEPTDGAWVSTLLDEINQVKHWCQPDSNNSDSGRFQTEYKIAAQPTAEPTSTQSRIVVIDDETQNLQLITLYLSKDNYQVSCFDSAEVALSSLTANGCELILLDLNLDGVSGIKVLESLQSRGDTQHIPVVMVTGSEDKDILDDCLRAGARAILTKPFSKKQLQSALKSHLSK